MGDLDNDMIVRILYNALLDRDPDTGGLAFYTSLLDSGSKTLHQVATSIVGSVEFVKKQSAVKSDRISTDIATIAATFGLLYGREPSGLQMATMLKYGVHESKDRRQLARRIIGCIDRQVIGTPYSIRFQERDIRRVACGGFSLMFDEADITWGRTIGTGRTYEPHTLNFFRRYVKSGATVVDAGANIGYFTFHAACLVGDTGVVYAFEPNSENCRLILLSLRENSIPNVSLFPVALGAAAGYAPFTPAMGTNGTLLLQDNHDALLDPNCIIVPVLRLDDVVDRVDFIKVDTEGAEGMVIQGALNLITRFRPVVVSEFSPIMLKSNSNMEAGDYLGMFLTLNYQIAILMRDDPESAPFLVADVNDFVASYGDPHRFEDLAFIPKEILSN
jgi:FkbM family methyltransferase